MDIQSFDTRVAGIQAILSFTRNKPLDATQPANIPWLLALYDHLNDDDEEIREIAASATTPILGKPVVSIEASVRLLAWLVRHHGSTEELRTHAACRMIGHPAISARVNNAELQKLTPAETQLSKAMRFDASLFAVEEQNMYVDEVREALRWRSAFQSLSYPRDDAALKALVDWTIAGLRTLSKVAGERGDDGVLGWTSKPEVFAICSRVVVSGVALATAHEEVRVELRKFVEKGRETRVHGLLLEMCESTAI